MLATVLTRLRRVARRALTTIRTRSSQWVKPDTAGLARGLVADLARSRRELVLENALLRQQLVVLHRTAKRPRLTPANRGVLLLLAHWLRTWASALIIVRPETLLRWHRRGFRLFWRRKSQAPARAPRLSVETVALLERLARVQRPILTA